MYCPKLYIFLCLSKPPSLQVMRSPGVDTLPLLSALLCLFRGAVGATQDLPDGLKDIKGMDYKDGKWFFNDEEVISVSPVGGEKIPLQSEDDDEEQEEDDETEGQGFRLPRRNIKPYIEEEDDDDDVMNKETDVGWEPSTKVEKITPIKSMTKLKSVQEIKKMTPVNWIEEIISMKEVKSIEEIKEKIAREFIRKHGLLLMEKQIILR